MMDDVDTISVAVSGIDINNVESLDSRRLVAFINHYVQTTVSFLNHFSTLCETRLETMHYQLLKLEDRLTLLECKLSSGSAGLTDGVNGSSTTSSQSNQNAEIQNSQKIASENVITNDDEENTEADS